MSFAVNEPISSKKRNPWALILQWLSFFFAFFSRTTVLSASENTSQNLSLQRFDYEPTLSLLKDEHQEINRMIEELASNFEKRRRELAGLEIRLIELIENKNTLPHRFSPLSLYLKSPQFYSELPYESLVVSNNQEKQPILEKNELSIEIIGLQCSEFIKQRKKILNEDLEPRTRALFLQLLELKEARKYWLERQTEISAPERFARLTEYALDLQIAYLQRLLDHLNTQKQYATALSVYEECIEQMFSRYPATDIIGLHLREKIQQRLPLLKKEESLRKQIEEWTNSTIESRQMFRQKLEEFKQVYPQNEAISALAVIGSEVERWIEKNSRILHEIATDEECLEQTIKRCKKLVTQYCLWMQDSLPLKSYFKKSVGQAFIHLFFEFLQSLQKIRLADLALFSLLNLLFGLFILIFINHWIKSSTEALQNIQGKLGRVTKDSILLTFQALLWLALRASLFPLLLSVPFLSLWMISNEASRWALVAESGLYTTALAYLLVFIKKMSGDYGIFENHLRFSKKTLKIVFSGWFLHSAFFCISYFFFHFFLYCPSESLEILPARIAFMAMVLSVIPFKWRLARASVPIIPWNKTLSTSKYFNPFCWGSCMAIAAYSGIETAKGFFETAKIIFWCLEKLILIWGCLLLTYHLIVRIMLVHRRRISFERNLKRRTELLAQISKKGINEEDYLLQENESIVDLETLSSRALSLLCSITQISSLVIFWFTCPEFQPMLNRLDVAIFYPSVTLFGALKLSICLFLFYQLYRDLPSALDLLIFPHFNWTQNTRYTVKLLTRYGVFSLGLMFFYNQINAQASESLKMIGTLVIGALGFGIRDIFNSVISGIIILTVKTIQVGDTVNIGEITGVVTQVTILSTIVIDAEKKEFSIPNKNLINELFSRWPSDDLVNRISFKISIPSRCPPETVFNVLKEASQAIEGIAHNADENMSITAISKGILTYELILLVEDLQHQALIKTSLYEQILKHVESLGLAQDEISIHS